MLGKLFGLLVCTVALVAAASIPQARENTERIVLTAFAIDLQGAARTGPLDISIERWSTVEERSRLLSALSEDGQDGLLRELRGMDEVGRIRSATGLGYPLRYASQSPAENGGRRIVIVTDRPVGFTELRRWSRALDYPFLVAEVHLGPDNRGDGTLTTAAQVRQVNGHILVENFELQPIRLEQVRARQ